MLSSHVYYFWRSSLILLDSFVERPLGSLFQKEVFAINSINLFVLSSHVILSKCYYCSLKTINVLVHWLSLSFINELQTTVSTLYLSLTAFIHNTWYLIFEFIWHKTVSLVSYSFRFFLLKTTHSYLPDLKVIHAVEGRHLFLFVIFRRKRTWRKLKYRALGCKADNLLR